VTFDEDAALKKSRKCQLEEVYEEKPVIPRVAESAREVPRAAEPVREVITSPDEEILEDHDVAAGQFGTEQTKSRLDSIDSIPNRYNSTESVLTLSSQTPIHTVRFVGA
jgi:hypothetical protein